MLNQFSRTQLMLGGEAMTKLRHSRVAVFGVGGVGGYAVEVLARSGVGEIHLYDNDIISITNVNRQIIALTTNVGLHKVDVAKERILAINPACKVEVFKMFYLPANADEVDLTQYDYVADCIDTITAKMELIRRCTRLNVPLISSMGAANKMNAMAFEVADFNKTRIDPLARALRKSLHRDGITYHFKTVFSTEKPLPTLDEPDCMEPTNKHYLPASNAWVPPAAGLLLGSEIVKDLINYNIAKER